MALFPFLFQVQIEKQKQGIWIVLWDCVLIAVVTREPGPEHLGEFVALWLTYLSIIWSCNLLVSAQYGREEEKKSNSPKSNPQKEICSKENAVYERPILRWTFQWVFNWNSCDWLTTLHNPTYCGRPRFNKCNLVLWIMLPRLCPGGHFWGIYGNMSFLIGNLP